MGPETSEGCSTASGIKNAESRYQRTNLTSSLPLLRLVAADIHPKQWNHLLDRCTLMLLLSLSIGDLVIASNLSQSHPYSLTSRFRYLKLWWKGPFFYSAFNQSHLLSRDHFHSIGFDTWLGPLDRGNLSIPRLPVSGANPDCLTIFPVSRSRAAVTCLDRSLGNHLLGRVFVTFGRCTRPKWLISTSKPLDDLVPTCYDTSIPLSIYQIVPPEVF